MLFPKNEIIADIDAHVRKRGGEYRDWCVGIAKDHQEPLFEAHLLEEPADGFLYREAFTPGCAREITKYFVTERGATVDPSSKDDGGRIVYAYRKTPLEPSPPVKNNAFTTAR